MTENPLRIFVAMPGKDLGPHASFRSSDGVKESFLTIPFRRDSKRNSVALSL